MSSTVNLLVVKATRAATARTASRGARCSYSALLFLDHPSLRRALPSRKNFGYGDAFFFLALA
jgi:hypothetical protein